MSGTTNHKGLDARMRVVIFCVTGLVFGPLLLSDCTDSPDAPKSVLPFFDGTLYDRTVYHDATTYPTAEPQEDDIAGTWILDEDKISRPSGDIYLGAGAPPTELLMRKYVSRNGSSFKFKVSNLPRPFNQGHKTVHFASAQGIWNTYREGDKWRLYLHSSGGSLKADLLGAEPPYRLRLQLGDDSNAATVIFRKVGS